MEITSKGSGVSSQGSSSNEYFTADEVWMDLETGQGSSERDEPRIRVLGIMDAIRNGLYATFDRSPKYKNVKKGPETTVTAMSPCDVSGTDAPIDHRQDISSPFDDGSSFDSNGLMMISKGSSQSVKKLLQNIEDNVSRPSKQDLYDTRPVFGVDTRTFAARSSSDHAMVTKASRGKARNRRQRMTWPMKPCESDSSERMAIDSEEDFAFTKNESVNGSFHDVLMRNKSKCLVSDAVRKALSVVTVENVLQDSLLSYTDLQRGDIRFTSDLVFWTEDVGTSFTGDATAVTEKSKFVLTPYPKSKQQNYGAIGENSHSDAQISELPKCDLDNDSDEGVHKFESDEDCEDEQFFDSSGLFPEDSARTKQACDKEDNTPEGQNNDKDILSKEDVFSEQSLHQQTDLLGADDNVASSSFQMQSDPDCICGTPSGTRVAECDDEINDNHIGELHTKSVDASDSSPKQCKEGYDGSKDFFADDVLTANDSCCSTIGEFRKEPCLQNDQMSGVGTVLKENLPKYHKEEIEAAEEIVRDTMKVARSVVHHVYPKNEVRDQPLSEPQCWEDLLDLDEDDDVISLSDFDMSEIKFIKNELAEMRNTIGEVAQEIMKEKEDNCDSRNEMASSQGSNRFHQRNQQLVPKEEEGEEEEEGRDVSVEGVDDIRTKITFWEGFMKFGCDVTDKKVPSVAEKADRLVSCKFCNQGQQLNTTGELNDPSLNYSESWDNDRIVAVETNISNVSEGLSYHDARMERDEIQTKTTLESNQEPVISDKSRLVDTKSPRINISEVEKGDAEQEATLPKVKARISIWEKLPFRKGHLKKKREESVDLDTSTKEKVAFFEQISTPQSPFSRRSSSRFSFRKDDWMQRFQKKRDESTTTNSTTFEDSSFIQQPGGSYDSGIWTNAAFFENSLLESIDDAMREKVKGKMAQENGLGDVGEDHLRRSNEKTYESPCHSEDKDDSEWELAETEKTKSIMAPLPEQSHRIIHTVAPEEVETVMDSKRDVSTSMNSVNDTNNDNSSQGNGSYYSTKEESNGTSHLNDGHEFFLEMIGEHPVDVVEAKMSCDEQEDGDSFLEVVGSAMKLHEMPNLENKVADTRSDAKPDIKLKKKNNILAFFSNRKNIRKDAVGSKGVEKCKVEAKDEVDVTNDIDRKIAKKCKKKGSKNWGYVDIDPSGASIERSKPKKRWKLFRKAHAKIVASN